jgi:hypothetical protein
MAQPGCDSCAFRAKYDENHNSLLGKLWRWHINWCPGWKKYTVALDPEQRAALQEKYGLKKSP